MKIVFIYPTFESLGIEYLSAVLKRAGHEVQLILDPCLFNDKSVFNGILSNYFDCFDSNIKRVIKSKPDVLCFSVCTDTYKWAAKYAKQLKKYLQIPIVFGGVHPSVCPEEVLQNNWVDYVVQGEGEEALLELVNVLANGKIPIGVANVWSKQSGQIVRPDIRPLIQDLDKLPFPDKSLYDKVRTDFSNGYRILASRGCLFECSYCYNCGSCYVFAIERY